MGEQKQAMVSTPTGSGVICMRPDGCCGEDEPVLLPTGWSVLSIDVARGCTRLAMNVEPQDRFCIA